MSDSEDDNIDNIDFSVISNSIQMGGTMVEQIVNGIHYGSAEVRNYLRNECDMILECKVCRNLFRSFPNFVAHKRVYCREMFADKAFNSLPYVRSGQRNVETVVVQPESPTPSTSSYRSKNSREKTVVDKLKTNSFEGQSSAFKLYTKASEKIEAEKLQRKVQTVVMTPIATNPNAMFMSVSNENESMDGKAATGQTVNDTTKEAQNASSTASEVDKSTGRMQGSMLRSILEGPIIKKVPNSEKSSAAKSPKKLTETKPEERKRRKPVLAKELRPVKSNLGSSERSNLMKLSKEGLVHIGNLQCLICGNVLGSRKSLSNHMSLIHSEKNTIYPCLFCKKEYNRLFGVVRHIKMKHEKSDKEVEKLMKKLKAISREESGDGVKVKEVKGRIETVQKETSQSPSPKTSPKKVPIAEEDKSENKTEVVSYRDDADDILDEPGIYKCQGCRKSFLKRRTRNEHVRICKAVNFPALSAKFSVHTRPRNRLQQMHRSSTTKKNEQSAQGEEDERMSVDENTSEKSEGTPRKDSSVSPGRDLSSSPKKDTSARSSPRKSEKNMPIKSLDEGRTINTRHSAEKLREQKYIRTRFLDKRRAIVKQNAIKFSRRVMSGGSAAKEQGSQSRNSPAKERNGRKESPEKSPRKTNQLDRNTSADRNLFRLFDKVEGPSSKKYEEEEERGRTRIRQTDNGPLNSRNSSAGNESKSQDTRSDSRTRSSSRDSNAVRNKMPVSLTGEQRMNTRSRHSSGESSSDRRSNISMDRSPSKLSSRSGTPTIVRDSSRFGTPTKNRNSAIAKEGETCVSQEDCVGDSKSSRMIVTPIVNSDSDVNSKKKNSNKRPIHIFALQGRISGDENDAVPSIKVEEDSENQITKGDNSTAGSDSRSRRKQKMVVREIDEVDGTVGEKSDKKEKQNVSEKTIGQKKEKQTASDKTIGQEKEKQNASDKTIGQEKEKQNASDKTIGQIFNKTSADGVPNKVIGQLKRMTEKEKKKMIEEEKAKEKIKLKLSQELGNFTEEDFSDEESEKVNVESQQAMTTDDPESEKQLDMVQKSDDEKNLEEGTDKQPMKRIRIINDTGKVSESNIIASTRRRKLKSLDGLASLKNKSAGVKTSQGDIHSRSADEASPNRKKIVTSKSPSASTLGGDKGKMKLVPYHQTMVDEKRENLLQTLAKLSPKKGDEKKTSPTSSTKSDRKSRSLTNGSKQFGKSSKLTVGKSSVGTRQRQKPSILSKSGKKRMSRKPLSFWKAWKEAHPSESEESQPPKELQQKELENTEEVCRIEEIWVDKKIGKPPDTVKKNTIHVMLQRQQSSQAKGGEKCSNRMYVLNPSTDAQAICLDTKHIESLVDAESLKCVHCEATFATYGNLRRHAVRHLGWKRFKCKLCKFSSYNKSDCNTHVMRSHAEKCRLETVNSLIIDLHKEASVIRLQKKQETLRKRQQDMQSSEKGGVKKFDVKKALQRRAERRTQGRMGSKSLRKSPRKKDSSKDVADSKSSEKHNTRKRKRTESPVSDSKGNRRKAKLDRSKESPMRKRSASFDGPISDKPLTKREIEDLCDTMRSVSDTEEESPRSKSPSVIGASSSGQKLEPSVKAMASVLEWARTSKFVRGRGRGAGRRLSSPTRKVEHSPNVEEHSKSFDSGELVQTSADVGENLEVKDNEQVKDV